MCGVIQQVPVEARLVVPLVPLAELQLPDDRGRLGRYLGVESQWVGLFDPVVAIFGDDIVLVEGSFTDTRDEPFPDAGLSPLTQGVARLIPTVEFTGDEDLLGIRRLYREIGPFGIVRF